MGKKSTPAQPTVLVADDEEIYVTVTTKMLERSGARVLSAGDGLEAVRQYERHKDEIALVFLDLEMPRLNGVETFRRLKILSPNVRVVIISGYVTPANRLLLDSLCPLGYIEKPMIMNDFLPYLINIHRA